MTNLERALASILESIEDARSARDALALAVLLQRKDSICAALAAPEHHWHAPAQSTLEDSLEDDVIVALPMVA